MWWIDEKRTSAKLRKWLGKSETRHEVKKAAEQKRQTHSHREVDGGAR